MELSNDAIYILKVHAMLYPIYYDTETTGIRADKDRIIEIAAYDPVHNKTFVSFINPGLPIPAEATSIHNITDEMVANAPSFYDVARDFVAFCGEGAVLIAHNNDAFDKPFLENEFKRADAQMPVWPFIDTLKWARKYRPDLPRHSLQSLREVYGIAPNQAHRALDDVQVLHQIFSIMIDDLSMETLLQLMSKPATASNGNAVATMPFGKHQGKPLSEVPKNYLNWLRDSGAFEKSENQQLCQSFQKLGLL